MYDPPPQAKLDERRLTPEAAAAYGILWDDKKESWILPIRDPYTGEFWGWQEKNDELGIVRNRPRSVAKSRALFGMGTAVNGGRGIIVESPLDAARLLAAGVRGGLASYGVQISREQLALVRNRLDSVVFAFDNDIAGLTVSAALKDRVHHNHRFLNYSVAPHAKDPGDMTDEECRVAVEQSTSCALTRFDLGARCTVVYS
jgi:5S rRNA maturation endonuclease (ribonuclease M5)